MKDFKYRIVMALLRALSLLPLRMLYILSDIACFFVYHVFRYRLKVVRDNLKYAFAEKSERERREIEKAFYHHLCDLIVETVKLLHISDEEICRRVKLINTELIKEYSSNDRPIVLFMGHIGNWEWVPALTINVDDSLHLGALYMPLHNKLMNRVMLKVRARFRQECIPSRRAYRRLVDIKREGRSFFIGFIADQRPVSRPLNHWVEFFGHPTAFMAGGETIGRRLGAAFVYLDIERVARGYYNLTFRKMEPTTDSSEQYPYTLTFFKMLEENIRRQPEQWLWSHNRWKDRLNANRHSSPAND